MSIFSRLFGRDDSHESAARILERTASPSALVPVAKAAPNVPAGPGTVGGVPANAFAYLRGPDSDGEGKSLGNPYERSVWVQRAIKHVGEPIASMPLRFATMTPDGLQAFIDPILAAFWEWPAIGPEGPLSRAAVVEATVGWLKLRGEAFWVLGDDWLLPRGARSPFIVARPDQMRHVLSQDGGRLLGWLMRDATGRDWELLPEQVIHPKLWNPYDPVRGCPEYASARTAAEADVFAAEFGRNLMAGNGDRGPIISSKGVLSTEQMLQIEKNLLARKAAARAGSLKLSFLPADVDVHDPQIAQVDSEFVAGRVDNRKEIYMAFGVPSSMAEQMHRATTAHESDRYILIEDTCKPAAARISSPISALAMRMLGIDPKGPNHLTAYFDFEQHSIMLQARTERVDTAVKLAALGMPFRDANAFLNLQAPSFPGDDVGHLPLALQTVTEANAPHPPADDKPALPETNDDPPEDDDDDPATLMLRALAVAPPSPLEQALGAVTRDNPNHDDHGRFAHSNAAKGEKVRAARAKGEKTDAVKQRYTEEKNEPEMARLLRGKHIPGNAPQDIEVAGRNGHPGHAIELKTLTSREENKVDMKASSIIKKLDHEKQTGKTFHTVVLDDRKIYNRDGYGKHGDNAKDRVYYYRRGVGTMHVSAMHQAKSAAEVRRLIHTKDEDLPLAAQRKKSKFDTQKALADWLALG